MSVTMKVGPFAKLVKSLVTSLSSSRARCYAAYFTPLRGRPYSCRLVSICGKRLGTSACPSKTLEAVYRKHHPEWQKKASEV